MTNYQGPLTFKFNGDTSTVIDPRFGTGANPVQPEGWSGGGSGPSAPAPLTGDTYTAPGIYIPSGALDAWRAARDTSGTSLAEVVIFGDSVTYGAANPGTGVPWYSWIRATKDAATADGVTDGGHGWFHPSDYANGYNFNADGYPRVASITGWQDSPEGSRVAFADRSGGTTNAITIEGKGTRVRLVLLKSNKHGLVGYSIDGGTETVVDCYFDPTGKRVAVEPHVLDIGGLSDGIHSVRLRVAGASPQSGMANIGEFQIEFVRDTGVVFHRNATSGGTMKHHFRVDANEAKVESLGPWNMGMQSLNNNAVLSNTYYDGALMGPKPQYRNIKLGVVQMGTNDLSTVGTGDSLELSRYIENVAYFARTCRAIGASGLIVAPPMSQLPEPGLQQAAGRAKAALVGIATAYGIAFADFQEALGYDLRNLFSRTQNGAGANRSHLTNIAYQVEGQWLWDNVLSL